MLATQWINGVTYALLFDLPSQDALAANQGEIISFFNGFTVGKRLDLTDVKAKPFTKEMLEDLKAYVEDARQRFHVSGASMAIVQDGNVIYTDGFGTTAPDNGQPVTTDTLFMIGSVTKSMTTMMMGTLVDDGILDWNQPVTRILPSFALSDAASTPQIRVRDLVNMSSGVAAYDTVWLVDDLTPDELLAQLNEIPVAAPPGKMWNYSNQMVTSGGYISALASGVPMNGLYEGYIYLVQSRVFDPIGMANTTFDFDAATSNPNHALPFAYNPVTKVYAAVPLDSERSVRVVAPAGGVWSNAADMARYLQTELSGGISPDGKRVISEATLHTTQKQEIAIGGSLGYGMGWFTDSYNGLPLVWHGGNTMGFSADLAFLPSADLGVVILSNAAGAGSFNKSVREYVFELAFGLEHNSGTGYETTQAAQDQAAAKILGIMSDTSVDPNTVAPFLGNYEHGVKVEMSGDQLWLVGVYLKMQLHPTNDTAGDYTGGEVFSPFLVHFGQSGKQITLEMTNLWSGGTLTLKLI